jgi:hypothetical protein
MVSGAKLETTSLGWESEARAMKNLVVPSISSCDTDALQGDPRKWKLLQKSYTKVNINSITRKRCIHIILSLHSSKDFHT